MPVKKQTKSRTSNRNLTKKSKFPKWVIAIVLLLIAGTGLYLVYNSFASSTTDSRIGDNNGTTTLYCKRDRSKCYFQQPQPPNTISTQGYVYVNRSCRYGLEYRLVGALKSSRKCLDVYIYP